MHCYIHYSRNPPQNCHYPQQHSCMGPLKAAWSCSHWPAKESSSCSQALRHPKHRRQPKAPPRCSACWGVFEVWISHRSQEKQINVGKLMNYFQLCSNICSNMKEKSHTKEIAAEEAERGAQTVNIFGLRFDPVDNWRYNIAKEKTSSKILSHNIVVQYN